MQKHKSRRYDIGRKQNGKITEKEKERIYYKIGARKKNL